MPQEKESIPLRSYLSKKQLADHFNLSERKVNDLLKQGLPHLRIGNKILRFKRIDCEEWLERFTVEENRISKIVDEVMNREA